MYNFRSGVHNFFIVLLEQGIPLDVLLVHTEPGAAAAIVVDFYNNLLDQLRKGSGQKQQQNHQRREFRLLTFRRSNP